MISLDLRGKLNKLNKSILTMFLFVWISHCLEKKTSQFLGVGGNLILNFIQLFSFEI